MKEITLYLCTLCLSNVLIQSFCIRYYFLVVSYYCHNLVSLYIKASHNSLITDLVNHNDSSF